MKSLKDEAKVLNDEIKELAQLYFKYGFSMDSLAALSTEELEGLQKTMACYEHFMNFFIEAAAREDELKHDMDDLNKKMDKVLEKLENIERKTKTKGE